MISRIITWSLHNRFLVIAASVWVNLILRVQYPASHRLSDNIATALLAFDILQLTGLLYLTGGLENPFAMLFLAPVLISATALERNLTIVTADTDFQARPWPQAHARAEGTARPKRRQWGRTP